MEKKLSLKPYLAALVVCIGSEQVVGQSMHVIGGGHARECFQASVMAVRIGDAKFSDIEICDKAITHENLRLRDLTATYVNRGVIYSAVGQFDRAAQDYEKAIRLDDDQAESYLNRGNLWFIAQRFDRAIEDYDRAIALEIAQEHVAKYNRGMAYENIGDLEMAEADYQASLDLSPGWDLPLERLQRLAEKRNPQNL